MRIFVPPIKCQGIKTKLVSWISESLDFDYQGRWIEPFFGSGVVGFNMRPKNAIFADTNPHLINFYKDIQTEKITPGLVREFLEFEGNNLQSKGSDCYYEIRTRFNDQFESLDFLFLNRACFNGMIRFNKNGKFNVPFCKKENRFAKAYITKIVNQVDNIRTLILNHDWTFLVQDFHDTVKLAKEGDLLYCDPPYIDRHVDYYNGWSEAEEKELFTALSNTKANFILSTWHSNKYRENEYIKTLWSNFYIVTKNHFYHVGASERNRNEMLEALVCNFSPRIISSTLQEDEQLVLLEPRINYENKKAI
ncbi:MAG: Dam family site-specific DNA-(adenine-N6)-methyltransferase [Bacteroidetes bacterium]|nr:Dam family site-specific DNA-(adenine-N6)-methyltransferase [Bacteroidota bacterium]MBU2586279.1 Dam family site-specific DNA-(adenine-N6)-methyltransferase [Bacteroidota bacterium]